MKTKHIPKLEPAIIVIFGITGDLSQRYLLPALYHLFKDDLLHEQTEIVGLTRQNLTAKELFDKVELCINEVDNVCDPVALKKIQTKTRLLQFDPNQEADYLKLKTELDAIETKHGVCMNRLYQLSIPPNVFDITIKNLGLAGLNKSCQHGKAATRVLMEKPFGYDYSSAKALIHQTGLVFKEDQVYRIDHYLAKETVQNILTFRAHNPMFAAIWDGDHIRKIEVYAKEKIGIEGRVNFYEGVGATRDLVQSHLLQLLALITMELPKSLDDSESLHKAKHQLLKLVVPAKPSDTVRAQYDGYLEEVGNKNSSTETYSQIKLGINNERWRGVPIIITTGKALTEKKTEITVTFGMHGDNQVNTLIFRLQPNEGIHLELLVKKPGFIHQLEPAVMDFSYQNTFGQTNHPDAYERVLVDAVRGDRTLFATSDEVLLSWTILNKLLRTWQGNRKGMGSYKSGSAGPQN
jgi:glucose-6-phosphate 1-dehydrogenase